MQESSTVPELYAAFRRQFMLCELKRGEVMAILTDQKTDRIMADTAFAAATDLGANVYELYVRGVDDRFMDSDPFKAPGITDALAKANIVVSFFVGFFSAWEVPVRAAGGRVLNILDTPEQLVRLQTTPAVKKAVLSGGRRMGAVDTVRATSAAGTDLTWKIDKELPIVSAYGYADTPGSLAQWGQAMVACFPLDGSANGRVVVQPGDVWILPYARMVQSPIELTVENGFIRKIQGAQDAFAFRKALEFAKTDADDMAPFAVSHLGWGMNPLAHWSDIMRFEGSMLDLNTSMRSYPANFLFSTGPGPKRKTRGHIDMPMNHCSLYLGDEKVIDEGRIVCSDMIADPRHVGH